jgi:phenol 2-monooxygenase
VRLYVDLGDVDPNDRGAVRAKYTAEKVIEIARRVLRPYTLDVQNIVWFSVYEVGQRVTDRFDDVPSTQAGSREPRVFIAGDACHTHSAKAGQGMNVSMQDAFNLGWKLAAVLEGRAKPELLRTYSIERHAIAQQLIEFDREWSKIMASHPKDAQHPELGGVDRPSFRRTSSSRCAIRRAWRRTTRRRRSSPRKLLTRIWQRLHDRHAFPFRAGGAPRRCKTDAARTRCSRDGAWRIYAFADASAERLRKLPIS